MARRPRNNKAWWSYLAKIRGEEFAKKAHKNYQVKQRQYYWENADSLKARARLRHNPIAERRNELKKFGLTLEDYESLLKAQSGSCYICKRKETHKLKDGRLKALAVDHDHRTGKVRKLLCQRCNVVLGMVDDSLLLLSKIKNYLVVHSD